MRSGVYSTWCVYLQGLSGQKRDLCWVKMGTITMTAESLTSWLCQDPGWCVSWTEGGVGLLKPIPEGTGLQRQRSWEISTRPVEGRAACPGPSRYHRQTTGQLHSAASLTAERGAIENQVNSSRAKNKAAENLPTPLLLWWVRRGKENWNPKVAPVYSLAGLQWKRLVPVPAPQESCSCLQQWTPAEGTWWP